MADALDSGSSGATRGGSNPLERSVASETTQFREAVTRLGLGKAGAKSSRAQLNQRENPICRRRLLISAGEGLRGHIARVRKHPSQSTRRGSRKAQGRVCGAQILSSAAQGQARKIHQKVGRRVPTPPLLKMSLKNEAASERPPYQSSSLRYAGLCPTANNVWNPGPSFSRATISTETPSNPASRIIRPKSEGANPSHTSA